MSRLYVDRDRCEGSRLCVASHPEAFAFGADGLAYVKDQERADTIQGDALDVLVTLCPTDAIRRRAAT